MARPADTWSQIYPSSGAGWQLLVEEHITTLRRWVRRFDGVDSAPGLTLLVYRAKLDER